MATTSEPSVADGRGEAVRVAREQLSHIEAGEEADALAVAEAIDRLVEALYYAGKASAPETVQLARRALAIKRARLPPGDIGLSASLENLGAILNVRGDYEAAIAALEQSLVIKQQAGAKVLPLAIARLNLGEICRQTGRFARAKAYFTEALTALEDHPQHASSHPLAMVHNNLGLLLHNTGDYLEAQVHLMQARDFWKGAARYQRDEARALNNLGRLFHDLGDYPRSRAHFEDALRIWTRSESPDLPQKASVLNNLGYLYHDVGRRDEARPLYREALAIRQKLLGANHRATAWTLSNLGLLEFEEGHPAEALSFFEQAYQARVKTLGEDHKLVFHSLSYLALLQFSLGELREGLRLALQAEGVRRRGLLMSLPGLAERQALEMNALYLEVFGIQGNSLDIALSTLFEESSALGAGAAERVFEAFVLSRGLVFDEMAARRCFQIGADDPETHRLLQALTAARQLLANRWVQGLDVDDARRRKEEVEEMLAARNFATRQGRERDVRVADLRAALRELPAGNALVSYVRFLRVETVDGGKPRSVPSYAAFVLGRSGEPKTVHLGTAQRIDHWTLRWRRTLLAAGAVSVDMEEVSTLTREAGTKVRELLWDPVVRHLEDVDRVFLVPDGTVHLVSFAGLPAEDERFLVESGPSIHYLATEADLAVFQKQERRAGGAQTLLALGRPAFDLPREEPVASTNPEASAVASPCVSLGDLRFEDLPATAEEIRSVTAIHGRVPDASPVASSRRVSILMGEEATELALKRLAGSHRNLHLATHGYYLDDDCASGSKNPAERHAANPLLLSGLVLAGANDRRVSPSGEDGILTAEEIVALDLDGVEMAVLSACSSGVGEIRDGEGVFGLRRAFQTAGVDTLVSSLWPVQDHATRDWMEAFYAARLHGGLDVAQAVRQASLSVLDERRRDGMPAEPFFWAAFVASGAWR